jgi:hypothetical protein
MASITTCDKCGKEISAGDYCNIKCYSVKNDLEGKSQVKNITEGLKYDKDLDSCYKCYNKLMKKLCPTKPMKKSSKSSKS